MTNLSRIETLTSLRFFTAFAVFVTHAAMLPGFEWMENISFGPCGVSVFYVISGFVIAANYLDGSRVLNSWSAGKKFYIARIFKIYPIHVISLLVALPLALNSVTARMNISDLPAHFLLVGHFIPFIELSSSPNKVAWSLSCEIFFYLLTPLLFVPSIKSKLVTVPTIAGMAAIFIASVSLALFNFFPTPVVDNAIYSSGPFRMVDYLSVIVLYFIWQRRRDVLINGEWLMLIGIGWLVATKTPFSIDLGRMVPRNLLWLPACNLIVLGAATLSKPCANLFTHRFLIGLGDSSYALYMFHESILRYVRVLLRSANLQITGVGETAIVFLLVFLISQICAWLAYKFIEKPFVKIGKDLIRSPSKVDKPSIYRGAA